MKRLPFTRPNINRKNKQDNVGTSPVTGSVRALDGRPSALQLIRELMIIFGVITLVVSTFLWWHYIQSSPNNVFWGVMNNSLQTPSTTIHTQQQGEGQTLDQTVRLNVQGQHVASGKTVLSQPGNVGKVTTETVGLPTVDYIRYTAISTTQKGPDGKPFNFDKLLNVWGKTAGSTSSNAPTNGDLYNQSVLGLVPYASLNQSQRSELLKLMRPAYSIANDRIEKHLVNGRPTYDYGVQVVPKAYVVMLKRFGVMTGLNQLEQIDPSNYDSAAPISFTLSVDVWSRQATTVRYPKTDRVEQVSGHGILSLPIVLPKNTISVDELQSRLQTLQ